MGKGRERKKLPRTHTCSGIWCSRQRAFVGARRLEQQQQRGAPSTMQAPLSAFLAQVAHRWEKNR
jgi:hypothetical protein